MKNKKFTALICQLLAVLMLASMALSGCAPQTRSVLAATEAEIVVPTDDLTYNVFGLDVWATQNADGTYSATVTYRVVLKATCPTTKLMAWGYRLGVPNLDAFTTAASQRANYSGNTTVGAVNVDPYTENGQDYKAYRLSTQPNEPFLTSGDGTYKYYDVTFTVSNIDKTAAADYIQTDANGDYITVTPMRHFRNRPNLAPNPEVYFTTDNFMSSSKIYFPLSVTYQPNGGTSTVTDPVSGDIKNINLPGGTTATAVLGADTAAKGVAVTDATENAGSSLNPTTGGTFAPPANKKFDGWKFVSGTATGTKRGATTPAALAPGDILELTSTFTHTSDVVLEANWVDDQFMVTYLPGAGTDPTDGVPKTRAVTAGTTLTVDGQYEATYGDATTLTASGFTPPEGHEFAGWSDGTTTYTGNTGTKAINEATTFTAQWTPIGALTVTYEKNHADATGTTVQTYLTGETDATFGDALTVANNGFTLTGRTFVNWNTAPDGTGTAYTQGQAFTMPAASMTLYAIWDSDEYNISWIANTPDKNDTDPAITGMPTNTVNVDPTSPNLDWVGYAGETAPAGAAGIQQTATDPTRTGWTFYGWYEDETTANAVSTAAQAAFDGGTTYTPTGYTLWNGTGSTSKTDLIDGSKTYWGAWARTGAFKVTYKSGEGSGADEAKDATETAGVFSHTVLANDALTTPFTAPTDKVFAYWQDEDNAIHQPGDSLANIKKDKTLTAIWKLDDDGDGIPDEYQTTVLFDSADTNQGVVKDGAPSATVASYTVKAGVYEDAACTKFALKADGTRAEGGYIKIPAAAFDKDAHTEGVGTYLFANWTGTADDDGNNATMAGDVAADVVYHKATGIAAASGVAYHANFANQDFTITYNSGTGGAAVDNATHPVTVAGGADHTLLSITDTALGADFAPRANKSFKYWQGSDGNIYQPTDVIAGVAASLTLTAVWGDDDDGDNIPDEYQATFNFLVAAGDTAKGTLKAPTSVKAGIFETPGGTKYAINADGSPKAGFAQIAASEFTEATRFDTVDDQHTFTGWTASKPNHDPLGTATTDITNPVTPDPLTYQVTGGTVADSTVNFTAKFDLNTYSVKYNPGTNAVTGSVEKNASDNGTGVVDSGTTFTVGKAADGEPVFAPADGFSFKYWTDQDGNIFQNGDTFNVLQDTVLTANWSADDDGDNIPDEYQTTVLFDSANTTEGVVKDGVPSATVTSYTVKAGVYEDAACTKYAINADGTLAEGGYVKIPAAAFDKDTHTEGVGTYLFANWTGTADADGANDTVAGDVAADVVYHKATGIAAASGIVYHANFANQDFTVTYNSGVGGAATDNATYVTDPIGGGGDHTVLASNAAALPTGFVPQTGKAFKYWQADDNTVYQPDDSITNISANRTLTAIWGDDDDGDNIPDEYQATFTFTVAPEDVTKGVLTATVTVKAGVYETVGGTKFAVNADGTPKEGFAQITPDEFTEAARFASVDSQYSFIGWTGDKATYLEGDIGITEVGIPVDTLTYQLTGSATPNTASTVTYTANFALMEFFIQYAPGDHAADGSTTTPASDNGNTGVVTSGEIFTVGKAGDPVFAPATGWAFKYWTATNGTIYQKDDTFTVSGDETLTANWGEDNNNNNIPDEYEATLTFTVAAADAAKGTIKAPDTVITAVLDADGNYAIDDTGAAAPGTATFPATDFVTDDRITVLTPDDYSFAAWQSMKDIADWADVTIDPANGLAYANVTGGTSADTLQARFADDRESTPHGFLYQVDQATPDYRNADAKLKTLYMELWSTRGAASAGDIAQAGTEMKQAYILSTTKGGAAPTATWSETGGVWTIAEAGTALGSKTFEAADKGAGAANAGSINVTDWWTWTAADVNIDPNKDYYLVYHDEKAEGSAFLDTKAPTAASVKGKGTSGNGGADSITSIPVTITLTDAENNGTTLLGWSKTQLTAAQATSALDGGTADAELIETFVAGGGAGEYTGTINVRGIDFVYFYTLDDLGNVGEYTMPLSNSLIKVGVPYWVGLVVGQQAGNDAAVQDKMISPLCTIFNEGDTNVKVEVVGFTVKDGKGKLTVVPYDKASFTTTEIGLGTDITGATGSLSSASAADPLVFSDRLVASGQVDWRFAGRFSKDIDLSGGTYDKTVWSRKGGWDYNDPGNANNGVLTGGDATNLPGADFETLYKMTYRFTVVD